MSSWSPDDAMAMERRHIAEGEHRVAQQDALVRRVTKRGNVQLARDAIELLRLMREAVDLSRDRLRDLEERYGNL